MSHEQRLVWCADIDAVDYVRSAMTISGRRAGRPRFDLDGRLLGWAELYRAFKPYVPGQFERRIFWLKPYDRGEAEDDGVYAVGCPSEAVDPRTLACGEEGWVTVRAWSAEPETLERVLARDRRIREALR